MRPQFDAFNVPDHDKKQQKRPENDQKETEHGKSTKRTADVPDISQDFQTQTTKREKKTATTPKKKQKSKDPFPLNGLRGLRAKDGFEELLHPRYDVSCSRLESQLQKKTDKVNSDRNRAKFIPLQPYLELAPTLQLTNKCSYSRELEKRPVGI